MEIIIINKGSEAQKCVLFSYYDRCHKYPAKDAFLSMETGVIETIDGVSHLKDDIEIYIDGEKSEEKRLQFLELLSKEPFMLKHLEVESNIDNNMIFSKMNTDANGSIFIKKIFPRIYIKPNQKSKWPIVIDGEANGIDTQTGFLFIVKPNEEIKLNFIKK